MPLALSPGSALLAREHGAAVVAVFAAPIVIAVALFAAAFLARRGSLMASGWLKYFSDASVVVRLAALFLALDAALHTGLVPAHADHDMFLALVFAADAVALLLVAAWVTAMEGWEPPAILLLVANLVAYAWFVDTGRESADAVGLGCQVLELVALGLVIGHTIPWSQARRPTGFARAPLGRRRAAGPGWVTRPDRKTFDPQTDPPHQRTLGGRPPGAAYSDSIRP